MTAFARTVFEHEQAQIVWEIKSVNHRYLEVNWKLPKSLLQHEIDLKTRCKDFLTRGKLDCQLTLTLKDQAQQFSINQVTLNALIKANQSIQKSLGQYQADQASTFLQWPGVLITDSTLGDDFTEALMASFEQAIAQLIESRTKEGQKLHTFIEQQRQEMAQQVIAVRQVLPTLKIEHKNKLHEKLTALQVNIDTDRIEQEFALLIQKSDITEELDRLEAHLSEIQTILQKGEPCGRRLDFLMQELNREANTLGAKSTHIITSKVAIELKVLIEQMREQIQNIE